MSRRKTRGPHEFALANWWGGLIPPGVSAAALLTVALLIAVATAFAAGRWRPDAVALLALLALLVSGTVTLDAGLAGFGSPALIAMAAVFVLSAGLERTGVAASLGRRVLALAGPSELRLTVAFGLTAGLLSGVMNSIGAMAVLLPAAIAATRAARISPSRLLLPLALGTRLGGNLTLISGPSNLIASDALVRHGVPAFAFFEFLPLGGTFLLVGMAFIALIGRKWLPDVPMHEESRPEHLVDVYRLHERLFEARVPTDSPLAGRTIAQSDLGRSLGLTVLSITRGAQRIIAPPWNEVLRAGDRLVVQGRVEDLQRSADPRQIELSALREPESAALESAEVQVVEVILAPRSGLAGKTLQEIGFRQKYGVTVLAIWREGRPRRTGLADLPVQMGDALLVQGRRDRITLLQREPDFLVLEPDVTAPLRTERAPWALLAVVVLVAASTAGLPIAVATLLAAGLTVLSGCVTVEEIYRAVDWRALVFMGAILPLGTALSDTGAAAGLTTAVLRALGANEVAALAVVLAISIGLNQVMPSIAATAVLAPLAIHAATGSGANPHAFVMAVIAGTGTTFTPISNPVNLLVMGPGGYQMRDYVRIGLPLAVLLGIVSLVLIPAVWPL